MHVHMIERGGQLIAWNDDGLCFRYRGKGFVDFPAGDFPKGQTLSQIMNFRGEVLAIAESGTCYTLRNIGPRDPHVWEPCILWTEAPERIQMKEFLDTKSALKRRRAHLRRLADAEAEKARKLREKQAEKRAAEDAALQEKRSHEDADLRRKTKEIDEKASVWKTIAKQFTG